MKITITSDKIAAAAAEVQHPQRRMTVSLNVTGLDAHAIAEALLDLATRMESDASREEQLAALREAVTIHEPDLATTTRFALRKDDASIRVFAGARMIGSASFIETRPVPVRKPARKPATRGHIVAGSFLSFDVGGPSSLPWLDNADEDEDEDEDAPAFVEDEAVEFWRADRWREAIIVDQTGEYTWLVEDEDGKRWEANEQGIRQREADDW